MFLSSKIFQVVALCTMLVSLAQASCPNKCSGHGSCEASDVCACQQNWIGGDCSARQCPFTRAWSDVAQNKDDAHYYAECGNRGTCDRATGLCLCDTGYTGVGCRRMACPNKCSGHGTCEFIEELAIDNIDKRLAGNTLNTYAAWDTEKIVGCKCDPFHEGHDCSSKMCPKGDDPLTVTDQVDMVQYLQVTGQSTQFAITYYDLYGNEWTTETINPAVLGAAPAVLANAGDMTAVCDKVQENLRRLPNHALDSVLVTPSAASVFDFVRTAGADAVTVGSGATGDSSFTGAITDAAGWRCDITFQSETGSTGLQHVIGCTAGGQATAGSQPLVTGSVAVCSVGESVLSAITVKKLTESKVCSGRGTCDEVTGMCACYDGHKGGACEKQEALV